MMASPSRAALLAALLLLTACGRAHTPVPTGPVPVAVPEREELHESPAIVEAEITPVDRGILGDVAYDLPVEANSWVQAELDFLVDERREVIGRWMERGDYYEDYIKGVLRSYGLPTDLYHLAMIESGFLPTVRSRAGAVGMWQFMAPTARGVGLRVDELVDERMDPVRATHAAARHLRYLHRSLGDWALAAAAYNAGWGRITRGLESYGVDNFWDLAQQGDLAQETKHYVPRLYAMTVITRGRERFGFPGEPGSPGFAYDSIHVEYATPLSVLAELGDVSEDRLARLNPHLLRGTTPAGGYWVWVPEGEGVELQRAYLSSDFRRAGGYGVYVVRPGDNLSTLAALADMRSSRVRELNPDVDFDPLQIGERLQLPYLAAQTLTSRPGRVASVAAEEEREESSGAEGVSHVVAAGETLWGLARRYDVTVEEIREANGLEGDAIRPGQRLEIPAAAGLAPRVTEHVVASGESLWSIARRYGCTVAAIQEANDLGERSTIQPGQKLVIPT